MATVGNKNINPNLAFRIEGDPYAYSLTPTSINRGDTFEKYIAQNKNEYRVLGQLQEGTLEDQITTLTPDEADELFKQQVGTYGQYGKDQSFVNSFRNTKVAQSEAQAYLSGQTAGGPDPARGNLRGPTTSDGKRNAKAPNVNLPEQKPQAVSQPTQPAQAQPQSYTVVAGDNLSKIAQRYGVPVSAISGYRSGNPNLIYPGEVLKIGITSPNPAPKPSLGSGDQEDQIQAQLQDNQAQMSALQKYGLDNTDDLSKDEQGNYAPKEQVDNDKALADLGLGSAMGTMSLDDVIKKVSEAFGVEGVNEELLKLDNDYAEKLQLIGDNPWISEGLRSKQSASEQSKYEQKKSSLIDRLSLQNDMVGMAVNLYQSERSLQQQMTLKAMEIRQKQVESNLDFQRELAIEEFKAGLKPNDYESGIIGEYQFAVENGYEGTFSQYQNEDANRKQSIAKAGVGGSGLTPGQINTTVNSIAGAFDNEQIVKDFNQANSQYQLMDSLGTGGKNPGDDIAFVYSFAKLMDPNSVVREGEYATIQKYAQSFLDAKTLEAIRLVKNTNFLSASAKQSLLNTAKAKIKIMESQYTNVYNEYQRQIEDAYSGAPRQITQYNSTGTQDNLSDDEAYKVYLKVQGIPINSTTNAPKKSYANNPYTGKSYYK